MSAFWSALGEDHANRNHMKLYSYFNSSASYRVRIALALKGLSIEQVGVNLRNAEHRKNDFLEVNPFGMVPTLVDGSTVLSQSLAIVDYLDQLQPDPLLIPANGSARGQVLEIAQLISCDIHPLNNLRVLEYLTGNLGLSTGQKDQWYVHWISEGFNVLEARLPDHGWCVGETPSFADCCLIPQATNAERMKINLQFWPRICSIVGRAKMNPAFMAAHPSRQLDYVT